MFKITPKQIAPLRPLNSKPRNKTSRKRALDYYLLPKPEKSEDASKPDPLFTVTKNADNECLLANLSENLASADAMISNLAFDLEGHRRQIALGIQQLIELSSLLATRALDNVDPR